jgi:hypothetical protein
LRPLAARYCTYLLNDDDNNNNNNNTPKPVYSIGESSSTNREFTANRPDITIKNKKKKTPENMYTDRCGNICK